MLLSSVVFHRETWWQMESAASQLCHRTPRADGFKHGLDALTRPLAMASDVTAHEPRRCELLQYRTPVRSGRVYGTREVWPPHLQAQRLSLGWAYLVRTVCTTYDWQASEEQLAGIHDAA